jgi:hypothetical protein
MSDRSRQDRAAEHCRRKPEDTDLYAVVRFEFTICRQVRTENNRVMSPRALALRHIPVAGLFEPGERR